VGARGRVFGVRQELVRLSISSIGCGVVLRFGEFVLNLETRQLSNAGGEVHLSPKAFELLQLLVSKRPQAVPKRVLQELLWPDTFVAEANLPNLVGEIRAALGDDPRTARFIRTVARFGYAFAPAVLEDTAARPSDVRFALVRGRRQWPLGAGENILGREGEGAAWFDSSTVSRRHARIVIDADRATLDDLESKNGTFLRGERLAGPVPLRDGDQLRLGSLTLTFRATVDDGATQTVATSRTTAKQRL
jgi:DNA-binding winged helix-turn-helix (wHTH) protein